MKRKDILMRRLLRLQTKAKTLDERAANAKDVAELAAITEQRSELKAEIDDVQDEIKAIEEEEAQSQASNGEGEQRSEPPADANVQTRNANIVASFRTGLQSTANSNENVLESMEYREAFRNLWTNHQPIPNDLQRQARSFINSLPKEQRSGFAIDTSDTAVVIPLTIMREVINKVKTPYGNIYDAVAKTSLPGAIEYPIGEFEAEFNWVTEDTVAPEQDIGAAGKVSFGYFEAELRIAQTFLSSLLSIEAFEVEVSNVIARAYRKFMDNAVVNGTGNGQMTGLAAATTKTITMTAAQMSNWQQWDKRFFAELTPGYEDGMFIFARSTVIKYLKTMADANNRPLFYEATGLTVGDGDRVDDRGFFYGREIKMTVPTIVKDFDTANQNDVIGYFFQPDYYVINENFGFTVDKYYNRERRKWITVATVVVDGKPVNNTGFIKILKG